ncbi:MAG: response regulator, partial [Vulcanimicrobiaceae bacterium]
MHLVRNAVVHGIESPERRLEGGKAPEGIVTIKAQLRGNGFEVTIEDDGAGLDRESIAESVRERGLSLNDIDIGGAIFLPGISTSKNVTELSGRGVGLDAVRSRIESLRGTVTVHSLPGKGTSFTLLLPLTLSTLRAILFDVAGHRFAIESSAVERVVRPKEGEIVSAEGRRRLLWSGSAVALVDAAELFGMEHGAEKRQDVAGTALLLKDALGRVALWVDAVLEEREVVVGPLGARMSGARSALGATILADGSIAVIIRANYAVEHALSNARTVSRARPTAHETPRRKHILLVEDSITTRTLERSILEAAGYLVTTAADGEEGWRRLAEINVDLVVCDVDMPVMDGFGLTGLIRRSERLRDLPIILVTGRTSDGDRLRGLELGANAYITTSTFDQAE